MKKKKNKIYFGKEVENAVIEYNNEPDTYIKSKIYKNKIEKAFNKLVENIINRYKFPYFKEVSENLQDDVVTFLVINMHKYDPERGRAFSFFSTIAKNYLIQGNDKEYEVKISQQIIDTSNTEYSLDIVDEEKEDQLNNDMPEYIHLLIQYWDLNIDKIFTKRQDIMIADAIISLFRVSHNIENFNKKSLYVLIREITGLKTQYITSVVNKMRIHNEALMNQYSSTGYFNVSSSLDL